MRLKAVQKDTAGRLGPRLPGPALAGARHGPSQCGEHGLSSRSSGLCQGPLCLSNVGTVLPNVFGPSLDEIYHWILNIKDDCGLQNSRNVALTPPD